MRRVLRKGFQNFEVLEWHACPPEDTCKEFRDKFAALEFLRPFMRDSLGMISFRKILNGSSLNGVVTRQNDQQVLEQLAWRLVSGQVKIAPLPAEYAEWRYLSPAPEFEPREEPPLTAAPVEPVAPAESPVPPAVIALAALLKQAAISGTPFCEP